jgi:acyl carrier protein
MISERLKKVIWAELHLDHCELDDSTTAPQVPGWDSLSHVRIICAVEKEYSIRFKSLEVLRLKTVGELQAAVDRKTQKTP